MGLGALSIAQPQQQRLEGTTLPAPGAGMNTTGALYGMQINESIYTFNMIPSEFGPRTRLGYREHSNGITGDGIRTIIPFDGVDSDHVADKLFVSTNDAIWDCSLQGAAVSKFTFVDQTADSGWGHFTHYVNDDGTNFLIAAFELNGLFEYISATETWQVVTGITFPVETPQVDAGDIDFVVSHKQRLWLVPRGVSHAYYLPVGAKAGTATRFDFGNKFKHGGELVGLYNWTIDGGDGVDDYLVAVSGGGDIIMYRGGDPSSAATWETTGTWYVGELPSGRRGVSEVGGDLWILSTQGVITARALISGVYSEDETTSPAFKISRLIRNRMYTEKNFRGWEVGLNANEAQFVVNSPEQPSQPKLQYVYSIPMDAWGIWRGVPAKTFGNWNGRYYVGSEDATPILWEMVGDLDQVYLDSEDGDPIPIEFSMLSSYQDYGKPAQYKRIQYLRPTFLGNLTPNFEIVPIYNYNIVEPTITIGATLGADDVWGTALWDQAIWGGELSPFETLQGGGGLGLVAAYAIRGETTTRVTLASIDVMWDSGGYT